LMKWAIPTITLHPSGVTVFTRLSSKTKTPLPVYSFLAEVILKYNLH
jgi:hypothetical protein